MDYVKSSRFHQDVTDCHRLIKALIINIRSKELSYFLKIFRGTMYIHMKWYLEYVFYRTFSRDHLGTDPCGPQNFCVNGGFGLY